MYGTRFTLALVKKRLEEAGLLQSTTLREVLPGRMVELPGFEVEFISVTHSTIDCVALAVRTPMGVIIHTGDFKIDQTPVGGAPFDLHAFARYGNEGRAGAFQRFAPTWSGRDLRRRSARWCRGWKSCAGRRRGE